MSVGISSFFAPFLSLPAYLPSTPHLTHLFNVKVLMETNGEKKTQENQRDICDHMIPMEHQSNRTLVSDKFTF